MGLSSSAQSFQRLLDHVLDGVEGCFVYLDDIMLHAPTQERHDQILEEVLKRLNEAGLSIALDKCKFAKESIDYLGYRVDKDGIKPLERKIDCIYKFPTPTKQKELLHYLGAVNYYRASLPRLPLASGASRRSLVHALCSHKPSIRTVSFLLQARCFVELGSSCTPQCRLLPCIPLSFYCQNS